VVYRGGRGGGGAGAERWIGGASERYRRKGGRAGLGASQCDRMSWARFAIGGPGGSERHRQERGGRCAAKRVV